VQLATLTVLSESEILSIHQASLDALATCGVKLLNARALSLLKKKGMDVDEERQIVRFSRSCLEDALSAIPRRFDVFDRRGKHAFLLGDGVPRIAAGHNAIFWVDSKTGQTRPSTVADVELFARICQKLDGIDMIGIPVMPQDVPNPRASLLYGVRASVENSVKPIFFSTDSCSVNRSCINLLAAAFEGDLQRQAYGIAQFSPTSPLFWESGVLEAILETVETGVPIAILPEPNAGVSAPYTLAGLLTVNNIECLSGLAMIQALKPGHKVLYANSWTTTDMRTGAALVGSAETTACRVAGAQLARFYGVPSHTTAPNSDNHAHDEQNAWEKSLSQFCAVGARHDLIVNCGMFATGITCSHEQLIMDEEISEACRRICRGIAVNEETVAADLIRQTGPQGGTYLTADHTLTWLRSDEYLQPRISVRGPRSVWEAGGRKDAYRLAGEKVREYRNADADPFDAVRAKALDEIVSAFPRS